MRVERVSSGLLTSSVPLVDQASYQAGAAAGSRPVLWLVAGRRGLSVDGPVKVSIEIGASPVQPAMVRECWSWFEPARTVDTSLTASLRALRRRPAP